MSHALNSNLQVVGFPVRVRRPRLLPRHPAPPAPVEDATPIWKLLGVAVLGWFGLMAVVTILAV